MKTLVFTSLFLASCGSAFDGKWTAPAVSAGGLSFDFSIKFAGNASDTTTRLSAGGNLLLQTVSTATYKTTGSGDTAKIEFTTTAVKASDAQGSDVPATKKQCAAKANCEGFSISLGGMEDCQCAVNAYSYTQTGENLTIKGFGGTDVTFARGK